MCKKISQFENKKKVESFEVFFFFSYHSATDVLSIKLSWSTAAEAQIYSYKFHSSFLSKKGREIKTYWRLIPIHIAY